MRRHLRHYVVLLFLCLSGCAKPTPPSAELSKHAGNPVADPKQYLAGTYGIRLVDGLTVESNCESIFTRACEFRLTGTASQVDEFVRNNSALKFVVNQNPLRGVQSNITWWNPDAVGKVEGGTVKLTSSSCTVYFDFCRGVEGGQDVIYIMAVTECN